MPWFTPAFAAATVLALVVGAVLVASVTRRHVSLDDGTVWVTSVEDGRAARFNVRLGEADASVAADGTRFDVAQHDGAVVLAEDSRASAIDPATLAMDDMTDMRAGMEVLMGSSTLAVVDADGGEVWVGSVDGLGAIRPTTDEPHMRLGVGGLAAVDADGVVYGYRPRDGMVLAIDDVRAPHVREVGRLGDGPPASAGSFTVVGGRAVVATGDEIVWDAGRAEIAGAGRLTLQSPSVDGAQRGWVAAAWPGGLAIVDLDAPDAAPRLLESTGAGEPARPVSLEGCVVAAFSRNADNYVRACGPRADARFLTLDGVEATSELRLRVSHRLVVLNDVAAGVVWDPDERTDAIRIAWRVAETRHGEAERDDAGRALAARDFARACSEGAGRLQATDDRFGVRVGARRILDVLRNDEQTGCAVLRVTAVGAPRNGSLRVSPVYGGRYLQLDATGAAAGDVVFDYEVGDGRGSTSKATVTLEVTGDADRAPAQTSAAESIDVERGARWSGDVLGSFTDPDGDPLTLVDAVTENTEGPVVSTRADGLLTFDAASMREGRAVVRLTVSDGHHRASGVLHVSVRPEDTLPAALDPLVASAAPGAPTHIDLTPAVHATSARAPALGEVKAPDGATARADGEGLGFVFTADEPGTYHVPYVVAQGRVEATGLVRVEVEPPCDEGAAPVAVNDVALLDADGAAIVDPLDNDVDPTGGVLAVTSVKTDPSSHVKAGVEANRRVHLTAARMPAAPVRVEYAVANASGVSTGTITLHPATGRAGAHAPRARDTRADVRCGGIVSVDIHQIVSHPDGAPVTLDHDLEVDADSFDGLVFVSSDAVRYQAGDTTGSHRVTYTVRDEAGASASATITFVVHRADADAKEAPEPRAVEAQAVAGSTARIEIPLRGIDADGDDVRLLGLGDAAPRLGRIGEVGADHLLYEAYPDASGTDEFTYAVEDWTGRRAQATVRVGVVARGADASVCARDDAVRLRPGTRASVPVLLNDVAGDGRRLSIVGELETQGVDEAVAVDGAISFTAPERAGTSFIVYTAADEAGLTDHATLVVTSDPAAPIAPPTVCDYRVPAAATIDRRSVDVDVAPWIANPSGGADELVVDVDPSAGGHARVRSGTTLTIELTDEARAVPYTVTNTTHGVSSTAFVHVPAYGVFPPTLRPKTPALRVDAGASVDIPLARYVRVGAGKTPVIADRASVSATKAANDELIVDDSTLRFTARDDYAGPASITFSVSDGRDDGGAVRVVRSATLTLPITVVGRQRAAPTFSSTQVDVVAGEAPTTIDLTALTHTADGGRACIYGAGALTGPITSELSADGRLSVSAATDARPGERATIPIEIDYGAGTLRAGLTARVVASKRPLARVAASTTRVEAGSSVRVDVTAGAYNPFPGTPLTIASAVADAGSGLTVEVDGTAIVVGAARDIAVPSARVLVTVADATGDPDRRVGATFVFVPLTVPQAPSFTRDGAQARDGAVLLRWTPGATGGSPIVEYEVRWSGGARSCGTATACRVDGVDNGVTLAFTVRARNEVGWSADSLPLEATPGRVPGAPDGLTVEGGYREATASWRAPAVTGGAIAGYRVELTVNGRVSTRTVKETHARFALDDDAIGDASRYSLAVRAFNGAGDGETAEASGSLDAWGEPDAPSLSLVQQGDRLVATVAPGAMRGAGCASVSWSDGATSACGEPRGIPIERSMYFRPYTLRATLTTRRRIAGTLATNTASVTPDVRIGAPRSGAIACEGATCTLSWSPGDPSDGVEVGWPGDVTELSPTSRRLTLAPWRSCAPATLRSTLNGRRADETVVVPCDHTYRVAPALDASALTVTWSAGRTDAIDVVNTGAFDVYGRPATYELRVGDPARPRTIAWDAASTSFDVPDAPEDAQWSVSVSIDGFDAVVSSDWRPVGGVRRRLGATGADTGALGRLRAAVTAALVPFAAAHPPFDHPHAA